MAADVVTFDDSYFVDPHEFYREVQRRGPIHRFVTPSGVQGWLVTGDRLARTVLTDPRISKSRDTMLGVSSADETEIRLRQRVLRRGTEWVVSHMLGSDPPDHTRLRNAVADFFTPAAVAALLPRIDALAAEFVDSMDPGAPVDLVSALACPLPVAMICEITGLPRKHHGRI
ncbi:cytochrome P450 [Nocardia seriolae]|uniref:Uncharacterized protein n=1 Tax=Nocardia seriolae TaxID=37332 RepID=A0A0B8NSP3_9NOCA|nr:cytochrome P450 [Nocardia seriolae]MTJ62705.1 hypothetical protein [Nocardia seriolae]MTJ76420.1 hypothetical protein [Nocardia seriolae]MTJ87742.1 hypothetical protein [Nocardia seriolae]MTK31735.1 hypothetical protein [Nocardia seriolae]MTK40639.1 hypothetical protein [Nocardia seriolae]